MFYIVCSCSLGIYIWLGYTTYDESASFETNDTTTFIPWAYKRFVLCDYVTNSGPQTLPFKDTKHPQSSGFPGYSPRPHPHRQPTHPHLRRHAFIGVYIAVLIFYARQSIIECEWRTDLRTPGFWLGGWNIIGIGPSTGQGIKGEGINCEAQAKARICKGWSLKGH